MARVEDVNSQDISNKIDKLKHIIRGIKNEIESIDDPKLQKKDFYKKTPKLFPQLNKSLEALKNSGTSKQLLTLMDDILINYSNNLTNYLNGYYPNLLTKYNDIHNMLYELSNDIKRVEYLSLIKERNVLLVGGNGAGKSSFASYLKDSLSNNIVVIPAQKFLVFNLNIINLHLMDKEGINSIQKDNFIRRGRMEGKNSSNHEVRKFKDDLSELFSKFVTVLVNEQIASEHEIFNESDSLTELEEEKDNTILSKLNSLWHNLIPDIKFKIDTTHRTLIPVKNNKAYSLNSMSDGEKVMLYYIAYVLLAESESFIVVDEPETFLNASNFNRLWDALEAYRSDCKFIYISHVVDFIVSRTNTDLLWCKNFEFPDYWEIEPINSKNPLSEKFPRELLSELLGARKPILFCEGEKSSLDYSIYSSLFKNEAIIYPVGGHREVIQYTKSYNELSGSLNSNKAIGIIDADMMSEAQIQHYKDENIYTLEFNEIENLLFTKEVIVDVLQHFDSVKVIEEKINTFKGEVLKVISSRLERFTYEKIKKYVDTSISNFTVNNAKKSVDITNEIKEWIEQLNIEKKSNILKKKLKL